MTAMVDIKADQEVFSTYGSKSVYDFLLHYGFVYQDNLDENFEDYYPMYIDLFKKDDLYQEKLGRLSSNHTQTYMEFKLVQDVPEQNDLLSWSRFVIYAGNLSYFNERADAAKLSLGADPDKTDYANKIFPDPIDIDNESDAWQLIKMELERSLSFYPNSIEEDLEIL